ncbi:MAG: hypothetical protein OQK82_08595 [Candidatus Pacearchaeota archaeon]|nr:hypothetical protein [Candidatus Pacearchaeota archaeon]
MNSPANVSELAENSIWENPARIFSLIAVQRPERSESPQDVVEQNL